MPTLSVFLLYRGFGYCEHICKDKYIYIQMSSRKIFLKVEIHVYRNHLVCSNFCNSDVLTISRKLIKIFKQNFIRQFLGWLPSIDPSGPLSQSTYILQLCKFKFFLTNHRTNVYQTWQKCYLDSPSHFVFFSFRSNIQEGYYSRQIMLSDWLKFQKSFQKLHF